jgi:hypothetical protein
MLVLVTVHAVAGLCPLRIEVIARVRMMTSPGASARGVAKSLGSETCCANAF